MSKTVRARCTLKFKQEVVRLVTGGQSIAAAARSLGVVEQTLFNWDRADREGKLKGADSKVVSAEQMQIIIVGCAPSWRGWRWSATSCKKATAYFAKAQS